MAKTIAEQITELQQENERLHELEKLFEKACQITFGCSVKAVKKQLATASELSDFEAKIRKYFSLENASDLVAFSTIFCTENSLNYYKSKCGNVVAEVTQKQE